jgi:hypothetical protein
VKDHLQERLWGSPLQPSEGGYGRAVLNWTWLLLLGKWVNNAFTMKKGMDFQRNSLCCGYPAKKMEYHLIKLG